MHVPTACDHSVKWIGLATRRDWQQSSIVVKQPTTQPKMHAHFSKHCHKRLQHHQRSTRVACHTHLRRTWEKPRPQQSTSWHHNIVASRRWGFGFAQLWLRQFCPSGGPEKLCPPQLQKPRGHAAFLPQLGAILCLPGSVSWGCVRAWLLWFHCSGKKPHAPLACWWSPLQCTETRVPTHAYQELARSFEDRLQAQS